MRGRARFWLIIVAIACTAYGLFSIAIYTIYFGQRPWQDWMVYYSAARAYLDGNLPLIFDGERFTAHMNAVFREWLPEPLSFHPWLYPPTYLLLLLPFGMLSFSAGCVVFLTATFVCLVAAIWCSTGGGYRRWVHLAALALAPAVAFNVGTGQNAFLTTALMVGGFGLLNTRPWLAGALLGLLTYKPQLCLLVPVALVAAHQWRALAGAAVTATLMVLASLAVLGVEPWRAWFDWFVNAPPELYQTWLKWGRLHGESVYTNLVLIGAPHMAATLGQWLVTLLCAVAVWWCWRRPIAEELRLAVLLAATVLAAPHVTNYDAVLLVVAATLVFIHGLDHGFGRGGVAVPLLVWMIQLFNPPDAFRIGLITPVLTALLIVSAIAAARAHTTAVPAVGFRGSLPGALRSFR